MFLFRNFELFISETFYVLVIPFIFWCINKSMGKRLLILLLLTSYINILINSFFSGDKVYMAIMTITVFWGYLGYLSKKNINKITILILIAAICIGSNIFNNYSVAGILLSVVISVIIITLFVIFDPKIENKYNNEFTILQKIFLVVFASITSLVVVIFLRLESYSETSAIIGGFTGGILGIILEKEFSNYSVDGILIHRILRYLIGITIMAILFQALYYLVE
ncbi:MAG: hypothetical protein JXR64_11360, partial [Spirochaetales bacterium]|nr:hypothetical protein [Spirochaetales bacterium]